MLVYQPRSIILYNNVDQIYIRAGLQLIWHQTFQQKLLYVISFAKAKT